MVSISIVVRCADDVRRQISEKMLQQQAERAERTADICICRANYAKKRVRCHL